MFVLRHIKFINTNVDDSLYSHLMPVLQYFNMISSQSVSHRLIKRWHLQVQVVKKFVYPYCSQHRIPLNTSLSILKTNLYTLETCDIHHYTYHSEDLQSSSYKCTRQYLDHKCLVQYLLHRSYKLDHENNKVDSESVCTM